MTGQTFLHYRILEKIGEGGMGSVYKAQDTHLDRIVAVKFLPPEKTADSDRRQRFVQEAKAASSLNHPNIVIVHDISSDQGHDFIVMEYVDGKTLDQLIGRRGMKLNEALGYAVQVADGLAKAHAAGIVHRDLKTTNIMVTDEGRVAMGIAPLQGGSVSVPEKDWIVFIEQDQYLSSPAWSPDGALLYYLSESDGPCSVRVQKLDPRTKKPIGDGQTIFRSPQTRFNLNRPRGDGAVAVARDRLAIWMGEGTGNIYMTAPKKRE
jgi:serine/threonine protein kinase